jgi:hypothetical protein
MAMSNKFPIHEDVLANLHAAVAALLDRMAVGDLTRVCSRRGITEAEVAAALARFDILHEPSEASP